MEGKIIITSDSTCDLSPALLEENHISLARLSVILGDTTYRDGEGIEPQTIFDFVEKTGDLPKTAAPSLEDYLHFFRSFTDKGNTVIHFNISSKASGSPWRRKRRSERTRCTLSIRTRFPRGRGFWS